MHVSSFSELPIKLPQNMLIQWVLIKDGMTRYMRTNYNSSKHIKFTTAGEGEFWDIPYIK